MRLYQQQKGSPLRLLTSKSTQVWSRRLHIYISMALLFVVLFYATTGITLNRPELFEAKATVTRVETQLANEFFTIENNDLVVDEQALKIFIDSHTNVSGIASQLDIYSEVSGDALVTGEVSLNYKGPGYNATVFIDLVNNTLEIEATDYGLIALLNDLHKGRNTGHVWKWFNDVVAVLMILFVLTGLCLLLPKTKTLKTALKWTLLGSSISLLIFWLTVP
ncbi:MAG: PepSY-associated TM helix domain-containing protein [Parashewanella sp.]